MGKILKQYLLDGQNLRIQKNRRSEMQYDTIITLAEANSEMSKLCEALIEELAQYKEIDEEEDRYRKIIGKTEYNR